MFEDQESQSTNLICESQKDTQNVDVTNRDILHIKLHKVEGIATSSPYTKEYQGISSELRVEEQLLNVHILLVLLTSIIEVSLLFL